MLSIVAVVLVRNVCLSCILFCNTNKMLSFLFQLLETGQGGL